MSACPKVSADRRFVRLKLEVNQTDPASSSVPLCPVTVLMQDTQGRNPVPFTQFLQQPKMNTTTIETNLVIPDGGTVLLGGGKKEVEVRSECGPPVLSRVPYINRLFKNVAIGREAQTVYVLVTPRILVNEEAPREHAARACGSPVAPTPVPSMPRELVNNPLPPYVIEPPDILLVEAARTAQERPANPRAAPRAPGRDHRPGNLRVGLRRREDNRAGAGGGCRTDPQACEQIRHPRSERGRAGLQ